MRRFAWVGAAVITGALLSAAVVSAKETPPPIDYDAFAALTSEAGAHRATRLIPIDRFNELAAQSGALILDTRSRAAFEDGHIEGAVNLPFSDFTDEALAETIGDTDRLILIYCNNNFTDDIAPVVLKSAPLALNIPTFINLYGYGYRNIYELSDFVSASDPRVNWTGDLGAEDADGL